MSYYNLEPDNVDLYLENIAPIELTGGNPNLNQTIEEDIDFVNMSIINNNVFKYLKGKSQDVWFKFNPKKNIKINSGTGYFEKNNFNVSFVINYLYKISNSRIDIPKDNIVLKLLNLSNIPNNPNSLDDFMSSWVQDVKLLSYAIPQIFQYGKLYTKDGELISNYIITKKYDNYQSLLTLNYKQAVNYVIKMLFFLNKLVENDIIIRNFKFSNIGYDFINSEIEFVLLDYTDTTLIRKTSKYFEQFSDGCDSICPGTFVPYFIIKDYFNLETNWSNKLDKLYTVGLAESMIFIMYKQDNIMEEFFSLLYYPSELKPCIHYYKYMELFDNQDKKLSFLKLLNKLEPKYIEMDKFKINPLYIRIIQNCFEKEYSAIKPPATYLGNMQQIYTDMNDRKRANARGLIQPINNENVYMIKDVKPNSHISSKIIGELESLNFNDQNKLGKSDDKEVKDVERLESNTRFIDHLLESNENDIIIGGSKHKMKTYKLQNSIIL